MSPESSMRILTLVLAAACLLVVTSDAHAYVRTQTCYPDSTGPLACEPGQRPKPLFWPAPLVEMLLNDQGSAQIPFEQIGGALQRSCDAWSDVSCSAMQVVPVGVTEETRVGYDGVADNVVVFRDDVWPHQAQPSMLDVLALTSTTYDFYSGEMVDADIELNTANFSFTSTNVAENTIVDLENTLVHELGHVIGFDHTPDVSATMHATAPIGELEKRTLAPDDRSAICDTYPLNGGGSGPKDGCCMIAKRPAESPAVIGVLLLLGLGWLRRRRPCEE